MKLHKKTMNEVVVGRFGAPHGLNGLIKVNSFTQPINNILHYRPWLIQTNGEWQPLALQTVEQRGRNIVAKPVGCNDSEAARHYTSLDIAITRDQLPSLPAGEYYWHELVGLRVVNQEGVELGVVDSLLATGANDVLVVKGERERLIPYLKQVILRVDAAKGVIKVDWDATF
ncbi:MAG: ribosome maturation factor RimM [Gammaproteobacteria bacterium]